MERSQIINCLEKIYDALEKPQYYLAEAINDEALYLCVDKYEQFEAKAREYTEKFAMVKVSVAVVILLFLFCFLCLSAQIFFF